MLKRGSLANTDRATLEKILGQVFDDYQRFDDPEVHALRRREFIFHMTDWIENFEALSEFFNEPENHSREAAGKVICKFLYHSLGHLNQASRLMLDTVSDPFKEPQDAEA